MVKRYPYLDLMKSTWFVRMAVPADVQPVIGAKWFKESTHESDPDKANTKAAPILAQWRRRIEIARGKVQEPVRTDFRKLAAEYQTVRGEPLDEVGATIVLDVIQFVMSRIGAMGMDQVVDTMGEANSLGDVFATAGQAKTIVESNTYEALGLRTPFLRYLNDWTASLANQKGGAGNETTLSQRLSIIRKFANAVQEPMETLSGKHVQKWLDGMKNEKKPTEPADKGTKHRKLSDIRAYWKYLQAHEYVPSDLEPFDNRIINNGHTESKSQERERLAYDVSEVPALWKRATVESDPSLSDLIQLGAYTGARLGELMNLTGSSVVTEDDITCFHIAKGKTRKARRIVPIHPAIMELVERLKAEAGTNGHLIPCDAAKRGAAMSKRFSRMKVAMGYSERYTFHCLRHTVIQCFREARCPLEVRNLIVGHEDSNERTNTGAGYGDLSPASRLGWIQGAIQYPV